MNKYISILRGINVSGQKKIKMTELKSLYEELRFENVVTYIQSGNVIFCSNLNDENKIKSIIQNKISKCYGFNVIVIILTEKKLKKIMSYIPFNIEKIDLTKFYLCFLENTPSPKLVKGLLDIKVINEEFKILKQVILIYCPLGYGQAKFNNNFFENKLKVNATTRNWNTTIRLLEMIDTINCKNTRG